MSSTSSTPRALGSPSSTPQVLESAAKAAAASLLHGTHSLPEQTPADRLLGQYAEKLDGIKSDPSELNALRTRVLTPRQPLTLALQQRVKEKDARLAEKEAKIAELEKLLQAARSQPSHPSQPSQLQPPLSQVTPSEDEEATELSLAEQCELLLGKAHRELAHGDAQDKYHADISDATPRTPVGERPFALSPTTTGSAFLVAAFAQEETEVEERTAVEREQRRETEKRAQVRSAPRKALNSSSLNAITSTSAVSRRANAPPPSSGQASAPTVLQQRPATARRFTVCPSEQAAHEVEQAAKRATAMARAAEAASEEAAAKAARAASVQGKTTNDLSASEAWEVTKAPREAAAAAKAAAAARDEAEVAAFDSRCADLGALARHKNENVRHFSKEPAAALTSLAAFVQEERDAVKRHGEAIGESLKLPGASALPSSRKLDMAPMAPLADRMRFTSDMTPTPLGFAPLSPFRRRMAAQVSPASSFLARKRAAA